MDYNRVDGLGLVNEPQKMMVLEGLYDYGEGKRGKWFDSVEKERIERKMEKHGSINYYS